MSTPKIVTDTGWKPLEQIGVGDDGLPGARVQPVTGLESQPCLACRSYEHAPERLRKHIASKKHIEVLPDGTFRHLIDKDVEGRNTKTYNIRDFGFCRLQSLPTQHLATCESWAPTRTISDMMRKLPRR